ncbi:hypothetical protein FHS96_004990 [Sphingomonas zeicaulis]|uniref:hypothetical protein n=1 Tax=Sphingomonas zeicaulis TaxID=1632740 RepID=UPI003D200514
MSGRLQRQSELGASAAIGVPVLDAPPPLSWGDAIGAQFRSARAGPDWGWNEYRYERDIIDPLTAEATKRGYRDILPSEARTLPQGRPGQTSYSAKTAMEGLPDIEAARIEGLLAFVQRERQAGRPFDRKFDEIHDRASLQAYAQRRRREDFEAANRDLEGTTGLTYWGSLVAGAGGAGLMDPSSYLPIGGAAKQGASLGVRVLKGAAEGAAINMGFAAVMEGNVRRDAREVFGIERGIGDTATDLAMAGVLGAVVGGGVQGAGELGGAIGRSERVGRFQDAAAQKLFDSLPEAVQRRWLDAGTIEPRVAAEQFKAAVPDDSRTPTEKAALAAVERDADIAEASPFRPTMTGEAANDGGLRGVFDAILADRPPPSTRSALMTSVASPDAGAGAAAVKAKIRQAESGGNDAAVPRVDPRTGKRPSSASGRYQFVRGTFLSYYKRRFGAGGLSDDAIWAKRFDGGLQERLMDDLLADNTASLRAMGQPATAGNLYLMHFLGPEGARKVFRAAPGASAEAVLGKGVVDANPFLRGMSAEDVIAWTHNKMGQTPAPRGAELRPDLFPDAEAHAAAQYARSLEENARIEREAAQAEPLAIIDDGTPDAPIAPAHREALDPADRTDILAANDDGDVAAGQKSPADVIVERLAEFDRTRPATSKDTEYLISSPGRPDTRVGNIAAARRELARRANDAGKYDDLFAAISDYGGKKGKGAQDARFGDIRIQRGIYEQLERTPRGPGREFDPEGVRQIADDDAGVNAASVPAALADAVSSLLGTGKWIVAPQISKALRARGYEQVITPARFEAMRQRWAAENPEAAAAPVSDVAQAPVAPDAVEQVVALADLEAQAVSKDWDDPVGGPAAKQQSDSLEHDIRMAIERGEAEQYRVDIEGEERSIAEILDETDRDLDAVEKARTCMIPPKPKGGGNVAG